MYLMNSVLVAFILISSTAIAADKQPLDATKIVGKWKSVKLEGRDMGNLIIGITGEYKKDGSVTLVAKIKQPTGVKTIEKNGTYKVVMKQLERTFDNETKRSKAWFQSDRLIVQDPELDSRVHYERSVPKK